MSHAAISSITLLNTTTAIKDNSGVTFLLAGTAAAGDGDIIQVGYFTGGIFTGTWVPITGVGSPNTALITSIGDGGDETSHGIFSINITFDDSDPTKSTDLPTGGTQLALRFFNSSALTGVDAATHYNTATDASWAFKALSNAVVTPTGLDMDGATELVWEDNSNPFVTSLVIPEPSSALLLGLGGVAFFLRRRR